MYIVCDKIETEDVEMRSVFAQVMEEMQAEDPRLIYMDADLMNSIGMAKYW